MSFGQNYKSKAWIVDKMELNTILLTHIVAIIFDI